MQHLLQLELRAVRDAVVLKGLGTVQVLALVEERLVARHYERHLVDFPPQSMDGGPFGDLQVVLLAFLVAGDDSNGDVDFGIFLGHSFLDRPFPLVGFGVAFHLGHAS